MQDVFKGKNILITGATGLIGTHLVERLVSCDDIHIVALGRNQEKLEDVFRGYNQNGQLSLMEGDVAVAVPEFDGGFDYIFHAASPIAGDIIRAKPVSVVKANLLGTLNCLEYLKVQGKGRMLVFSSATVYANKTNGDYAALEESTSVADTLDALNAPYSESKRMCEVIAKSYFKEYGVEALIARFSYMYGYSKQMPNTAFYEFINKSLRGEDIVLNNPSPPRRDNIHINDAVDGLLTLCGEGMPGESYNISSGGDKGNFAAIDEIAETMAKVAHALIPGNHVSVRCKGEPCERKPGLMLDNKKLKTLGWEIKMSLEDGIKQTMEAYTK